MDETMYFLRNNPVRPGSMEPRHTFSEGLHHQRSHSYSIISVVEVKNQASKRYMTWPGIAGAGDIVRGGDRGSAVTSLLRILGMIGTVVMVVICPGGQGLDG
jgi:hypothetical protein